MFLANEKKRNYFQWPEEAKSAFASKFGEFLIKDCGYPCMFFNLFRLGSFMAYLFSFKKVQA